MLDTNRVTCCAILVVSGPCFPSTGPPLATFHNQQFDLGTPIELEQRRYTPAVNGRRNRGNRDVTGSALGIERTLDFIRKPTAEHR